MRILSWMARICFHEASTAIARSLNSRSEQTQAQCGTDYNWASNSVGFSPCLLTAFVWGSCFTGDWDVPQLQQDESYTNPNSTTANLCTCSWAAYNLISACTACQGFESAVQNWAAYDQNCSSFLTDAYFPLRVPLPADTKIPFWAGTNPLTWNNGRFDTAQAQLLVQQNKPDLVQETLSSTVGEKSNRATIIGAAVG
ncbi:hypothetical protein B0H14DRAFT_2465068, partial [Mycena olivaceomarginata]